MLPFENVGGEPSENWKGSAFEEANSSHFESAGYDIVDLETRNRRLMELGFDPFEPVSRATAIGLGKDVAAQRLIVGSFRLKVIVYRSGLTKGTGVLSGARRIDVTMSITRIPL